jgi:hypothetical protein
LQQKASQVLIRILIRRAVGAKRVVVVEHPEIRGRLCPEVVRFGGMNVRVVSAASGCGVMVGRSIRNLLADVDLFVVDPHNCGSVYQAVDKRRICILIDLLDPRTERIDRLGPVVIFHRDYEDLLDSISLGA